MIDVPVMPLCSLVQCDQFRAGEGDSSQAVHNRVIGYLSVQSPELGRSLASGAMKVSMLVAVFCAIGYTQTGYKPEIPKTWDEAALAEWATPIAGLNQRPEHMSPAKYYALPVDNLRTYPVYLPGREPVGYWEMLHRVGPKPLVDPSELKTKEDWIEAGRKVFEEADHIHLRTFDPVFIEAARSGDSALPGPDGTVRNFRWVPTKDGVALAFPNCTACHGLVLENGTRIPGGPSFAGKPPAAPPGQKMRLISRVQLAKNLIDGGSPFGMKGEPFGMWMFHAFGAPWRAEAENARLKNMTEDEFRAWRDAGLRGGALPRWNGSVYYPVKVPDLIGIGERKYIDATGTHQNRGIGDLMRYAALVSYADATVFGGYDMLGSVAQAPTARRSDEALYALALYLQSLKPPLNPNPRGPESSAGERIFHREGCPTCHTPPLYTSNKLTLAKGFNPPKDLPHTLDVLPVSVGTDPGLALHTRKGTGYYKVPSLKGVWYRGHYLHDGAASSLEEMFDPERLSERHVRGGFSPPGMRTKAIEGHEFGLKLTGTERKQLIAFLKTL
jgi:mono/diheme cytochrome c family protein